MIGKGLNMKLDNLNETMELIRKIYTCEIPMFDEDGDDWTDEYSDFYDSLDDSPTGPAFWERAGGIIA